MNYTTVGVDIAKNVMQMHWIDPDTGEVVNKSIKRTAFLEHFANRTACLIGLEACGGAQHWARALTKMGHQVKLMPAKFVKASCSPITAASRQNLKFATFSLRQFQRFQYGHRLCRGSCSARQYRDTFHEALSFIQNASLYKNR